jgi:hypothetical protein
MSWAWLSQCRALLVRYEKKAENDPGFLKVAGILLRFRRWWRTHRTG